MLGELYIKIGEKEYARSALERAREKGRNISIWVEKIDEALKKL